MRRCVATVCFVALPVVVSAQSDSSARPRASICWRGKPAPTCGSFWVTEFSGEYSYASTQTRIQFGNGSVYRPDVSSQVLWTVGPMFNTSPTRALGGTLSFGFVNDGSRIAVEARRRHWTSMASGIDISAGPLRTDVPPLPNQRQHTQYGATTGISVGGGDLIHVNAHADVLLTGGRVRAGGTVGGGLGSYAAVGGMVVGVALVVAALIALARSGGDF